jgi:Planctomycete cytochrome C
MSKLDLRTRDAMLKGGEKGPALVPGNAEASPLYRRVSGLQQPVMPMAPVPGLTAREIAVLKDWIDQGAKWSGEEAASAPVTSAPTG